MGDKNTWQDSITLEQVRYMLLDRGCDKAYLKFLRPNNNSKNQIYVGPDFAATPSIPTGEITEHVGNSEKHGENKAPIYRAAIDWTWLSPEGISTAPHAQLIFYPQYPEVRLSSLIKDSRHSPRVFMNIEKRGKELGRVLIFGIRAGKQLFGVLVSGASPAAAELRHQTDENAELLVPYNLVAAEPVPQGRDLLLSELKRIHLLNWTNSEQLLSGGIKKPCVGPRCGGHTLEAHLGVTANGRAEPDFAGWEIKQHQVVAWGRAPKSPVTLMTPEPDLGEYKDKGAVWFVREYGHLAKRPNSAKPGGMHFSGNHKVTGVASKSSGLRLEIIGYSPGNTVFAPDAKIALVNGFDEVAAGWSFPKILKHWKDKHSQAAFIASRKRFDPLHGDQFAYDHKVGLGTGSDIYKFLDALLRKEAFLDPGSSAWPSEEGKWKLHPRSQFRIRHRLLPGLYEKYEEVDLLNG